MRYGLKNARLPIKLSRQKYYSADGTASVVVPRPIKLTRFVLAVVLSALAVPLLIMNAIKNDPNLAEKWSVNIAQPFERVAGTLTSWLPVSVFELCVVCLIIAGVFLFVRLVINLCCARFKRILTGILALGTAAVFVLNLYTLSMGFGYYRKPMPLAAAGEEYKLENVVDAAEYFLADYNALAEKFERDENGCVICPYSVRELSELLKREYDKLDGDYFYSYTPTAKPITNSWFLSDVLITGITFLPTGEPNVNIAAPPSTVAATMAHELAHTKGVQREGDANLISYYVLLASDNDYLRYCGYYETFSDFTGALTLPTDDLDEFLRIRKEVSPLVSAEHSYAFSYWIKQPDLMGKIGEFFNNLYLIFAGASNGTGSYDDGNKSDVVTPSDPITGEPEIDPDTQKPVRIPVYSDLQKIYFYLYEKRTA